MIESPQDTFPSFSSFFPSLPFFLPFPFSFPSFFLSFLFFLSFFSLFSFLFSFLFFFFYISQTSYSILEIHLVNFSVFISDDTMGMQKTCQRCRWADNGLCRVWVLLCCCEPSENHFAVATTTLICSGYVRPERRVLVTQMFPL